uniref:Putative zinc-type alcohol dehydrogenase-like protein YahK n=2 Tax=Lygus hesperus TaxID=30085 RepID=A0A146L401_LYGHE
MGANVTAFTSSASKVDGIKKTLQADEVVLVPRGGKPSDMITATFDIIIDTASTEHNVEPYIHSLKPEGVFCMVGLPNQKIIIDPYDLLNNKTIAGSQIGSIAECKELLQFCAEHDISSDVKIISPQELGSAFEALETGTACNRYVIDFINEN